MAKKILYVEDNFKNRLLVKRIVIAEGYEYEEAETGEAGWEAITAQKPDFILMDLRLPGEISGFELTRRIKAHPELQNIPIVVLTAYGNEQAENRAKAAGCDGFLTKPADIRQIRATLNQFLTPEVRIKNKTTISYAFI